MKLNKFNFYKASKYFLCATVLLMLAGLIVGIILGLNLAEAIGSSVIINCSLITLITMLIFLIYYWIRYNIATGFCYALSVFASVSFLVALISILRIPVADNLVSVLGMVIVISTIFNTIIFYNINSLKEQKLNKEELVQKSCKSSFKLMTLVLVMLLVVTLIVLAIFNYEVIMFVRPMLVGILASYIISMFIIPSVWAYFYKEKPKKKEVVDESVYEESEQTENK